MREDSISKTNVSKETETNAKHEDDFRRLTVEILSNSKQRLVDVHRVQLEQLIQFDHRGIFDQIGGRLRTAGVVRTGTKAKGSEGSVRLVGEGERVLIQFLVKRLTGESLMKTNERDKDEETKSE